jgi:CHAT domain-containing protein
MKQSFFLLLFLLSATAHSQVLDSIALHHALDSLLLQAKKQRDKEKFVEAMTWIDGAEKLLQNNHTASDSLSWTKVLISRGRTHYVAGQYPDAIPCFANAVRLFEKAQLRSHPDLFYALEYLAKSFRNNGQYLEAEKWFWHRLDFQQQALGKNHLDCARTQMEIARLYYYQLGNYTRSEELYEVARGMLEQSVGKNHPDYAYVLKKLADLATERDDHERAEPLYLEGLLILGNTIGKENIQYAQHLNNLGILHSHMGNYTQAEKEYLKVADIRLRVAGRESFEFAQSLNNLGILYHHMEQFHKADSLLTLAGPIFEKVVGKDDENCAMVKQNLGATNKKLKRFAIAEAYFIDALNIYERKLGKLHPEYLQALPDLATLYKKEKKYAQAEALYLEFLSGWSQKVGKVSGEYIGALKNITELYWSTGDKAKTRKFALEANDLEQTMLLKACRHLSEKELGLFVKSHSSGQNRLLSLTRMDPEMAGAAYNNVLFYKGFLLNAALQMRRMAQQDSVSAHLDRQLRAVSANLSALYARPVEQQKEIPALELRANELEKALAKQIAGYGASIRQVNWQQVQASLKPDEAAIEYVRFHLKKPKDTDSILYAALLILPGASLPQYVPLLEEKELMVRLQPNGAMRADYVNDLYSHSSRGIVPVDAAQKSLCEMLWLPLQKKLPQDIHTLYYAPAGLLHRINMGAISIHEDSTLADRYRLVQLKSTRQLVTRETHSASSLEAVLFGGIDFNADSTGTDVITQAKPAEPASARAGGVGGWSYLPGTDKEVTAIEQLLRQAGGRLELFKGKNATEEAFKKMGAHGASSPKVIHLATHGFFFPDDPLEEKEDDADEKVVFQTTTEPMLRSGLLMAGANRAWIGKSGVPGREDGILTAYEISNLDLSRTELAVLSACETGLGDIQGNEGVYGLQRAFKIAGVNYLIMSLWQVPDKQTGMLMTHFYRQWLLEKRSIPDAFLAAQQFMRESGWDPYYWAGFILVE